MTAPYACPACHAPVFKWFRLGEPQPVVVVDLDSRPHVCVEQGMVKPQDVRAASR